jgi:acetoin utilization deacetylase AcuC-like enzyme
MGFCLINNVAVAAAHARARGVDRVLVVDWDVHHGNGTQEAFFDDPHVLYVSLHQWPFYPGTGAVDEVGIGAGRGFTVNVPLSAGAADADYRAAFERVVLPVARDFAPELVLVSAGFDAHRLDPLAGMLLGARVYGWMATELVAIADRFSEGRIALLLEGGYDLGALEESVRECLHALTAPIEETTEETKSATEQQLSSDGGACERDVERARLSAAPYWSGCR